MKHISCLFLAIILILSYGYAQEDDVEPYYPTQEALDYREVRHRKTIPPYGLDKIKKQLKTIQNKYSDEAEGGEASLTPAQYNSLSLREKFTYTMIHPELYSQNCAVFIPMANEDKMIFAHLMSWTDEEMWSPRQEKFLKDNRDSVMTLIKESTVRSRKMGVNYKDALVLIDAWEMIPFIIEYYKSNPIDKDALTVLLLMMKEGEYQEFLKSSSYRKLYGSDYNYESYINYNSANEKLIFDRAMGYYSERANK